MSTNTLEIEMTRVTRQLEYFKLQLKYLENITITLGELPKLTYILKFSFALAIFFLQPGVETVIKIALTRNKSRQCERGFSK